MNRYIKIAICSIRLSLFISSVYAADQSNGRLILDHHSRAVIGNRKYDQPGIYNISSLIGSIRVGHHAQFVVDGDPQFMFGSVDIDIDHHSSVQIHASQSQGHSLGSLIKYLLADHHSTIVLNKFGRSKIYGSLKLLAEHHSAIVVNEEDVVLNEPASDLTGTIIAKHHGKIQINGWKNIAPEFINEMIKVKHHQSRTIGPDTSSKWFDFLSNRPTVVNQPIIINQAGELETQQRAEKVSWLAWLTSFMKPRVTVITGQRIEAPNNESFSYRLARLWYALGTRLTGRQQDPVVREQQEREFAFRHTGIDQEPFLPEIVQQPRVVNRSWWSMLKSFFWK